MPNTMTRAVPNAPSYWLVTTEYPPYLGGGIAKYAALAASALAGAGYSVKVFIVDYGATKLTLTESGHIDVYLLPVLKRNSALTEGTTVALSEAVANSLDGAASVLGVPNVVEFQDYLSLGYIFSLRSKEAQSRFYNTKAVTILHGPQWIVSLHDDNSAYRVPNYSHKILESSQYELADTLITPSSTAADIVKKAYSIEDVHFNHVWHPFDISDIPYQGDEGVFHCRKYPRFDLVFTGRFHPLKGCQEFFRSVRAYNSISHHSLRIAMIGGGRTHEYHGVNYFEYICKRFSKELEFNQIDFMPVMPRHEYYSVLQRSKIVCVPSRFEAFSFNTVEAMACGASVLATCSGGPKDIVEATGVGSLFNGSDPEYNAREIDKLLHEVSPEQQVEAVGRAREWITEELSPENFAARRKQLLFWDETPTRNYFGGLTSSARTKAGQASDLHVVIPFYNLSKYVEETVRSVVFSDVTPRRITIINDGSNESGAKAKCFEMREKYGLEVIDRENFGLAATRNFGARSSDAEYICFLDADDCVDCSYFRRAMALMNEYPELSFVGCWLRYFGEAEGGWLTCPPRMPYQMFHNLINSAGAVFRTDVFREFGFNDSDLEYGMEDMASIISLLVAGRRGTIIPEQLFNYRFRSDSMMRAYTDVKQAHMYLKILKKFDLSQEIKDELINLYIANGQGFKVDTPFAT